MENTLDEIVNRIGELKPIKMFADFFINNINNDKHWAKPDNYSTLYPKGPEIETMTEITSDLIINLFTQISDDNMKSNLIYSISDILNNTLRDKSDELLTKL